MLTSAPCRHRQTRPLEVHDLGSLLCTNIVIIDRILNNLQLLAAVPCCNFKGKVSLLVRPVKMAATNGAAAGLYILNGRS